ncbi:MAG TPA: hypothetical protein VEH84_10135 [Alphaproteobacteria bacterium]|nr:hypothetical protein [Alphaproteobacteria bacterium]
MRAAPSMRGVVLGQTKEAPRGRLDFMPAAPDKHVLGNRVTIGRINAELLMDEDRTSRWLRRLVKWGIIPAVSRKQQVLWDFIDMKEALLRKLGTGERGSGIRHPYDVLFAFESVLDLGRHFPRRRLIVEELLRRALLVYARALSEDKGQHFSAGFFMKEAREFYVQSRTFQRAARGAKEDVIVQTQNIYNAQFHARWYYVFSLLLGEEAPHGLNMFLRVCKDAAAMASINPQAQRLPAPDPDRMPKREWMDWLIERDKVARAQATENEKYRQALEAIRKGLPSTIYANAGRS